MNDLHGCPFAVRAELNTSAILTYCPKPLWRVLDSTAIPGESLKNAPSPRKLRRRYPAAQIGKVRIDIAEAAAGQLGCQFAAALGRL